MATTVTIELNNRDVLAANAVRITAIPSYNSLVNGSLNAKECESMSKRQFVGLLSEVHQQYASNTENELSAEILWITEPVEHQPYAAKINMYFIARAIATRRKDAVSSCEMLLQKICSVLHMCKYDYEDIEFGTLLTAIKQVNQSCGVSVRKAESLDNLSSPMLPACYGFDRIPENDLDLSKITDILIQHPNSLVSMHIIPQRYDPEERTFLNTVNQTLDTLGRGVMEQGIGNVSLAAAVKYAETYRYYANHGNLPLFQFGIFVSGERTAAKAIATRISNQLSTGVNKVAQIEIVDAPGEVFPLEKQFITFPFQYGEIMLDFQRNHSVYALRNFDTLCRFSSLITIDEASEFFRLPIGNDAIGAGFKVNESDRSGKTYRSDVIDAGDISIGQVTSSSEEHSIGINLKDLTKHALIVGTPGSGKTTFCVGLLDRLWKEHHIPFLVIEPAKNEYRAMVQSIPDLQIFTPGKNSISPFLFNPFVPPRNVKLESYKSTLKTAFAAAVSMSTPLDKIFEETINNCYSDNRWLDFYTSDDGGRVFNISDFICCFRQTFEEIGYTGDAKNIGRAGIVRLNGLANLFDNYYSVPIEDLLSKPTVIELAAIENSDQKALIISLLLLSILAYVNANYLGNGELKNVILLEEAHILLDADTNVGEGEANPSRIAQQLVKRMLAEIRSYGVGIAIADQSPRKVTTDVVALTDMKMVFRLVEAEDRRIIADSVGLNEHQALRLMRMKPGEMFLFFNRLDQVEEVVTPDYRAEKQIDISITDQSVAQLSTYWSTRQAKLRPFPECEFCCHCLETCSYRRRAISREIARRICRKNFRAESKDFALVRRVFGHITALVKNELNGEEFNSELMACVKVHIWRYIRYNTLIEFDDRTARDSIKNT